MQLTIGLLGDSPGWEIVLSQEGISYLNVNSGNLLQNEFAMLIAENISPEENALVKDFVETGGNCILNSQTYTEVFGNNICTKKKIKSAVPEERGFFSEIGLTDFYCDFFIPDSAQLESIDSDFEIYKGTFGKGNVLVLPFSVTELVTDVSVIRKKFYFSRKELPSEQVSKVSKEKIRKICQRSIGLMFDAMNLPLVQKWYYPTEADSVFLFRVDTDFCSSQDAEDLHKVCKTNDISGTWFADTESEERLKNVYATMTDQEIGLHCDKHYVYETFKQNSENIERGEDKLKTAEIAFCGFAAPFGDWNESLNKVLEAKQYLYSSEFSLDYDNFPFYPYVNGKFSNVLQIPIHPISLGRLRRSHFSDAEKLEYYKNIIDIKLKSCEPILIYHHPHHKQFDIFDKVFKYVSKLNVPKMNYKQFAEWWKERDQINPSFTYKENKISSNTTSNLLLKITTKGKTAIVEHKPEIDLAKCTLKEKHKIVPPKDEDRIRKVVWRDFLYDYESKKGRKRYEDSLT